MGRMNLPNSGAVYVDANTFIYRVEGLEPFASASAPLWDALMDGRCPVETSELTLLEVLVKPLRDDNGTLAAIYRRTLLRTTGLICHPIDQAILESAAKIRSSSRLKTPDSIHAATALHVGSSMFLTNDADFRKVGGLNVVLLGDIASD